MNLDPSIGLPRIRRYAQDILGVSLGKIMNYSQSEIDILHKHEYDFGSEDLNLISAVIEDFKEEYDINKTLLNSMSEDKEYEAIDEFFEANSILSLKINPTIKDIIKKPIGTSPIAKPPIKKIAIIKIIEKGISIKTNIAADVINALTEL